jgi:hypothetical protein
VRNQLPNRRTSMNIKFDFKGQTFFITCGIDNELNVMEVFGNSSKLSSDMDFLVADACIIISLGLQNGITLDEMSKSLKKLDNVHSGKEEPASLIGLIVRNLIDEQVMLDAIAEETYEAEPDDVAPLDGK